MYMRVNQPTGLPKKTSLHRVTASSPHNKKKSQAVAFITKNILYLPTEKPIIIL